MKIFQAYTVLALLIVLSLLIPVSGCVKVNMGGAKSGGSLVSEGTLATSVDSQSRPVNPSNTFTVTTEVIYLSVKLNNAPADTQILAKMVYVSGEVTSLVNSTLYSSMQVDQGTKYISFAIKPPPGGFPQGSYQVTVAANGQEQISIPFTVQNLSVQKGWPVISQFTATPDTVAAGQSVTLTWNVNNADRITLQPEIGTIPASGTRSITPSATTVYKIIAANDAGATTREITITVGAAVSGLPDLIITDAFLQGCMIYYKIKNTGSVDSTPSTTYLYVDNLFPPLGGSSYVDVMKAGQERTLNFSSFQWPWCGGGQAAPSSGGFYYGGAAAHFFHATGGLNYVDPGLDNHAVKVCANAKNEVTESNSTNNCIIKLWGILMDWDMQPVAHLATWKNSSGDLPAYSQESSPSGAYIKLSDGSLETVPEQIPQGWLQGYWGAFYNDTDTGAAGSAAIKIPAKLHFIARVGLADNAQGSDGVTFKIGLKDVSDTVNFLPGKKMTVPGKFEDWNVDLSSYEGQKVYFILRVEAGNSPTNDFAIWKSIRLMQVSD